MSGAAADGSIPQPPHTPHHNSGRHRLPTGVLAACCLLLVACNLRTVISAVSPVLPQIQAELGLSAATAGFALTLTVLCYGLGALICPLLLRTITPATLLTIGLVVLGLGGLGRALLPGVTAFFVCTVAVGIGVAAGNVAVPVLIRLRFAHRIGLITGAYAVTLSGGSVLAAGLTWPFIHAVNGTWRSGQLPWVALVAICVVAWILAIAAGLVTSRTAGPSGESALRQLMTSPLAWGVTALMGLQSLVFYSIHSWGPTVMLTAGIDATTAGWLLSLLSVASIVSNLAGPVVLQGRRTTPGLLVIGAWYVIGAALLPWGLVAAAVGVCVLGLAIGASLTFALTKISTAFPVQLTGTMSSMAQGFGYLLAGLGPWLFGVLHGIDPSWLTSLGFAAFAGIAFSVVGILVHRATARG